MDPDAQRAEEITAVVDEIRRRVRARNPNGVVLDDIPLPNLIRLAQARDAAEGKVASIGTVNPRAGGAVNSVIQKVKRLVSRALGWHVREQVNFNRAVMGCVQATLDAINETNQAIVAVSAKINALSTKVDQFPSQLQPMRDEARELKDIRTHWHVWRETWESKLSQTEIHFYRSLSDLQGAYSHRVTLLEESYRGQLLGQHGLFEAALARANDDLQARFWRDLAEVRRQYEDLIHSELRLVRQRASAFSSSTAPPLVTPPPANAPADFAIDWLKFAEKFRGSEESIQQRQQLYAQRFKDCRHVLDAGCGRGELLRVFKENGIEARGIDLSEECVALCRSQGLAAESADLFRYLSDLPPGHLDGIVLCQVVEHLPPARVPELLQLASQKLRPNGLIALETPNPECLAIFATHFYLDPTHQRPLPPALLSFYAEEAGFGELEVVRLYPAVESIPSLAALPEEFRKDFFGAMDYAVFARKLGSASSSA